MIRMGPTSKSHIGEAGVFRGGRSRCRSVGGRFANRNSNACLDVKPARRGEALIGREAALNVWHLLLDHAAFRYAAIESDPPVKGHRMIGFGASVFVTPDFADNELANPRPDINSRVVESVHTGKSVLADCRLPCL